MPSGEKHDPTLTIIEICGNVEVLRTTAAFVQATGVIPSTVCRRNEDDDDDDDNDAAAADDDEEEKEDDTSY